MKYAVDRSLQNARYNTAPVAPSLLRVLAFFTLRGKFQGIHPALAERGFTGVKVTDKGLHFLR